MFCRRRNVVTNTRRDVENSIRKEIVFVAANNNGPTRVWLHTHVKPLSYALIYLANNLRRAEIAFIHGICNVGTSNYIKYGLLRILQVFEYILKFKLVY